MSRDTSGPKNEPQYAGTGAPADAADLSEVATYAALVGNRKVGTTIQRNAATSTTSAWEGLLWGDTTDGLEYRYTSAAWVNVTGPFPLHRLTDARANVDGVSQVPVFTSDPAHSTTTTLAAPHAQGITIAAVGTYAIKVDIIFAVAATGLSYVQIDGDSTTSFARAPMAVGHDRVSVSVPAYRVFGANQILPITFYKNNGNLGTNYVSVVVTKLTV
jgi:hypothetical protein